MHIVRLLAFLVFLTGVGILLVYQSSQAELWALRQQCSAQGGPTDLLVDCPDTLEQFCNSAYPYSEHPMSVCANVGIPPLDADYPAPK